MSIKKVKISIIFLTTLLFFIEIDSYISYRHNKNYTVIQPVIITKNVFLGEKVSVEKIRIDYRGKSVKKEDINKYITEDNFKNYAGDCAPRKRT